MLQPLVVGIYSTICLIFFGLIVKNKNRHTFRKRNIAVILTLCAVYSALGILTVTAIFNGEDDSFDYAAAIILPVLGLFNLTKFHSSMFFLHLEYYF